MVKYLVKQKRMVIDSVKLTVKPTDSLKDSPMHLVIDSVKQMVKLMMKYLAKLKRMVIDLEIRKAKY